MFRNKLFVTRTLILQHGLYCFFKRNVIMKDNAIFRNWIDKADSAPGESKERVSRRNGCAGLQ